MTHGDQCPSCGGFCKKSGCERENEAVKAVMVFIDEFTGAEQERHPMFSEGYDYALSQVQQIIEAKKGWVGLTNGEIAEAIKVMERGNFMVAIQNIEAKLKEKNT